MMAVVVFVIVVAGSAVLAGPYPPAGGQTGSTAFSVTDSRFVEWAASATIVRGLREIDNPSGGYAYYGGVNGTPANTAPIGMPTQPQTSADSVSLGQGGTATLTFSVPISHSVGADGNPYDFAVFGNGFSSGSLEWCKPAFVEVSSDGLNFFRFPSVSLTPAGTQLGSYGEVDPTNLYDLAGKDPVGYGTGFNLGELAGVSPLLNIYDVTQVRLVDCVDDINPLYATHDSQGNIINGPWPANSVAGSEGFNLAGVGVLHEAPEPASASLLMLGAMALLRKRRH
jgi:hypothetical protein